MKRHINIPIFIPHLGCPNDCVFCNQRKISGRSCFDKTKVRDEIDAYLASVKGYDNDIQIAFFGGSFTGIDRSDMIYLLELAKEYIDRGVVSSVRLSTRPDYISEEVLEILKNHGVTSIELGIQSMSDKVLAACKRGHTAQASQIACRLIKEHGFELIGQMMTALPYSSAEDEIFTARELVKLGVDGARIYPTMVFAETELAEMYLRGEYRPPEIKDLVDRTTAAFSVFCENDIPVIRIGLQATDTLNDEENIIAGNYEPAMGELVISNYYYMKIKSYLDTIRDNIKDKNLTVFCPKGETSKIVGHKQANKLKILNEYNVKNLKVLENDDIILYNILINFS